MAKHPDPRAHRQPDHPIEDIFLRRWSPRALSEAHVSESDLMRLFEAARWAPSTYNEQEWRYLYARRGGAHWETFFNLLVEGNRAWCHRASVLMVILSHTVFSRNGKPNPVHAFDAGASFENMALQGAAMGVIVHGMAGFDRDQARQALHVPDEYDVHAMVAVGLPGDPDDLPEPTRSGETPSGRRPVHEFAREGTFAF